MNAVATLSTSKRRMLPFEPVTPYGIIGMVVILFGVAVIALAQRK